MAVQCGVCSVPLTSFASDGKIEIIDLGESQSWEWQRDEWETSGYCGAVQTGHVWDFGDNLSWVLDEAGTLTISGSGFMYSFLYDANGGDVGGWDEYSPWSGNPAIKSVVIEDGVQSIGCCAFADCENLETISVPESVVVIESEAFWNTKWMNNQPDGLVYINNCAYHWKGDIPKGAKIQIREGTTYVCDSCFWPDQTYEIRDAEDDPWKCFTGEYEFDISNLAVLSIPGSVYDLTFLVRDSSGWFDAQTDGLAVAERCIVGYKGDTADLTEFTTPDDVIGIGSGAFYGNISVMDDETIITDFPNLKKVTVTDNVKYIGVGAFCNLAKLESITIENPNCFIYDYGYGTICNAQDMNTYKLVDGHYELVIYE